MYENYQYVKSQLPNFKTAINGRTSGTFTNFDSLDDKLETQATNLYSKTYAKTYKENDLDALKNLNSILIKSLLTETYRKLLANKIDDKLKIRILDIGCGTGRFFHCFDKNSIITGLDVSAEMLEEARSPVGFNGATFPELNLIKGTLTPDFISNHKRGFDLIYSVGVYGSHAKYPYNIMNLCREMLKPNGVAILDIADIQTIGIARQKKWYGTILKILLQLKIVENILQLSSQN